MHDTCLRGVGAGEVPLVALGGAPHVAVLHAAHARPPPGAAGVLRVGLEQRADLHT